MEVSLLTAKGISPVPYLAHQQSPSNDDAFTTLSPLAPFQHIFNKHFLLNKKTFVSSLKAQIIPQDDFVSSLCSFLQTSHFPQ